jgi:subtilase family serine protease
MGITVCVAAGDSGSSDGVSDDANHVDFPASSPHVLACGGTSLGQRAAAYRARPYGTTARGRRHRRRYQQLLSLAGLAEGL